MVCPRCGKNNDDLNKWCIECGYMLEEKPENTESAVCEDSIAEGVPEYITEAIINENNTCEQKTKKIRHYMGWSIIAAVFGSIVFGIVAVIFSGITKVELASGNIEKAEAYSKHTKLFCLISLSVAIVKVIFIILTLMIFFSMSEMSLFLY